MATDSRGPVCRPKQVPTLFRNGHYKRNDVCSNWKPVEAQPSASERVVTRFSEFSKRSRFRAFKKEKKKSAKERTERQELIEKKEFNSNKKSEEATRPEKAPAGVAF